MREKVLPATAKHNGPSERVDGPVTPFARSDRDEKETNMRTTFLTVGALALSFLSTGCVATHKYVAKTIAPVEQRVSGTETKNTDQDKQLGDHTCVRTWIRMLR